MKIFDLRVNRLINPLGVETKKPLFSYSLGVPQQSYRIVVSASLKKLKNGEYDLWDSGVIQSETAGLTGYNGAEPCSRMECHWRVFVTTDAGETIASQPAFFEFGLLEESDWTAKWIGASPDINAPAPYFRRVFRAEKGVAKARIYICGLGYHLCSLNNIPLSDEVLSPAYTTYDKTAMYCTYDLTDKIANGDNTLDVSLGNGWYNPNADDAWGFQKAGWRHHPKMIFQMYIGYMDGSEDMIVSDRETRCCLEGPVVFNALKNGEHYDAGKAMASWPEGWQKAQICTPAGGALHSMQHTPIRIAQRIMPVAITKTGPDTHVLDFGQNISGFAEINMAAPKGTRLKIKYGELLKPDGTLDVSNVAMHVHTGEFQTDEYTFSGEGKELWHPRFVYHGFQYAQVEGVEALRPESIYACFVHTDFERAGYFECSNELINRIYDIGVRSTLGNFVGIPTDCPHREKNGWTGDALLSAEQTLYNFDAFTSYQKWLDDIADVQRPNGMIPAIVPTYGWGYVGASGPAWDSALIQIPWYLYTFYGDTSAIRRLYRPMKEYIKYMTFMAEDHLLDFGLGDWCPPGDTWNGYKCPARLTSTGYYFSDVQKMADMAALLGKKEDEAYFRALAEDIRQAFIKEFINEETGLVAGDCQTSYAAVLYFGLFPEKLRETLVKRLVQHVKEKDNHLDCGILGTKYIFSALSENGHCDLAFEVATATTYPSYGDWIAKGATTMWEMWNGVDSHNHHMFASIIDWFFGFLAGIRPCGDKVQVKPCFPKGLTGVKASHNGILVSWKKEGETYLVEVEIPYGTSGELFLAGERFALSPGRYVFERTV